MKVDFNNLRIQTVVAYEDVCRKLNKAIDKDSGYIEIEAIDLQHSMDNLRQCISGIICTFEKDNEDFKELYSVLFPNDNESMMEFNPNQE